MLADSRERLQLSMASLKPFAFMDLRFLEYAPLSFT